MNTPGGHEFYRFVQWIMWLPPFYPSENSNAPHPKCNNLLNGYVLKKEKMPPSGSDLEQAAREMTKAAAKGRPVLPLLRRLCPEIFHQIVRDGKTPGLLSLWGQSVNVDENVRRLIVPPAILHAIGHLAGIPMKGRIVHAGLQHTYGYLFSLLDTPYGLKRDRWLATDMERALGLGPSLLSPQPRRGTLLANLTFFLGQIVFQGNEKCLQALASLVDAVGPSIARYPFGELRVTRILEEVALGTKRIRIRTDLLAYPHPPPEAGGPKTLLIYSTQKGIQGPIQLVTAFPVRPEFEKELKASAQSSDQVDVRLQFNAYVRGMLGRTFLGRRSVLPRLPIKIELPANTAPRTPR